MTATDLTRLEPLSDKPTVRVFRKTFLYRQNKFQVVLEGCHDTRILAVQSRPGDTFSIVVTEPTKPFLNTKEFTVLMCLTGDEVPIDYISYLGYIEQRPGVCWHGFYLGAC